MPITTDIDAEKDILTDDSDKAAGIGSLAQPVATSPPVGLGQWLGGEDFTFNDYPGGVPTPPYDPTSPPVGLGQ